MVKVELADPPDESVRLVGFTEMVGPAGETVTPRATVPVNPLKLVTVMVDVVDEPCPSESVDGDAEILKSGGGGEEVTVKDKLVT
jgi:hypothetical protein